MPISQPLAGVIIAPLWRRLAAMVYDGLVICAITMAYWGLALYLKYGLLGATLAEGERGYFPAVTWLGAIFSIGLFYCFFWRRAGQTVGMRAWHLRVENLSGQNLSWQHAILRFICANLSFWLAGIGYWWQLVEKSGTLHDHLSQTRVVVLPKEKK